MFPVYQMGNDKAMRANQFDTQNGTHETASSYQTGISKVPSSNEILNENIPLYHVGTVKEMAASQARLIEGEPRYQVRNYQPEVSESLGGQVVNSGESLRFNQGQINDAGLNYTMNAIYKCCKCGCHSSAQSNPYYGLPPGLESQRPSVIMVPVNWNSIASGTSHMPLKVGRQLRFLACFSRSLTKLRRWPQRERQNNNRFSDKNNTLHVHHAFLYISLPSLHKYDVKWPNVKFTREREPGKAINSTISVWTQAWCLNSL